ncbi:hypothetical protein KCA24_15890, partial [Escherichia coli]|nr:hypothetical protein [Escherichia coli]
KKTGGREQRGKRGGSLRGYRRAGPRRLVAAWGLDARGRLAGLEEGGGAATNKKTLADYARTLSGEDE